MNLHKEYDVQCKPNASIFDYIFVLRPTLFFPVWTVFLAGYLVQLHAANFSMSHVLAIPTGWSPMKWHHLFLGGMLTLLLGGAFIINQIADVENDRQNHKLFLIANGHISTRAAMWEAGFLIGISVAGAFYYSVTQGSLFLTLFLVSGIFYSMKPFAWKDRPIMGLITNACAGFIVFFIGWAVYRPLTLSALYSAIPYVLAISSVYLCTTLPDIKGDKSTGKITFGVKYDFKVTIFLALILEFSTCLIAFWLKDWLIFVPAIISLPFFILATVKRQMRYVFRAIKIPIFLLSMAICWKCPIYFLFILIVFFFSRWYYRSRFNLKYPSFSV